MPFKLGKKAVRRSLFTPALSDFLPKATEWPAVGPRGWEYAVPVGDIEMLGNDQWGDCVIAAIMHFVQVETANVGVPLYGTLAQTLALYSAITGFDPNAGPPGNNPTDRGTDWLSALQYWQKNGVEVTSRTTGKTVVHQIIGFVSLDISSVAQMRYASDVFGGLEFGIQCPDSAMQDTSNWIYVPNSPIDGGHGINNAGQGGAGGHIMSWGLNIPYQWAFMANYLDEGYVIVSPFWLNQQGKAPSGLDLNGLLAAFKLF